MQALFDEMFGVSSAEFPVEFSDDRLTWDGVIVVRFGEGLHGGADATDRGVLGEWCVRVGLVVPLGGGWGAGGECETFEAAILFAVETIGV